MGMGKKKAKRWSKQLVDMMGNLYNKKQLSKLRESERRRLKKVDNHLPKFSNNNEWRTLVKQAKLRSNT